MSSDANEPTRAEIDRLSGLVLLEFGASWCGYCQALEPHVTALLERYPSVRRIWVEDGKGKPLGRSFGVKLWPTLVFLKDGAVVEQLVRPGAEEVQRGLEGLTS
jgi:thioredoxin 1